MQNPVYTSAVAELSIANLAAFQKDYADTFPAVDNWSKLKAPEKREAFLAALATNPEARKAFVVFYSETAGVEADWSEWETDALPALEGEIEDADFADAPATPTVYKSMPTVSGMKPEFVEGAFQEMLAEVSGMSAEDSDTALKALEDNLEYEHLRLGVVLGHIQSGQHYKTLLPHGDGDPEPNMRLYIESQTSIAYRKAMFLISNANTVRDLNIQPAELKGVRWSALRYITNVMTPENYKEWLQAAKSLTHVALIDEVKKHYASGGALAAPSKSDDDKPKIQSKLFNLYPDQKQTVEAAISKAKAEANVETTGAALDLICSAFTGAPSAITKPVAPDTSHEAMFNLMTKLDADAGFDGLIAVMNVIGEVWPTVDINVALPKIAGAEAAE